MDQPTFADLEYQGKKRKTRRDLFLERMDGLIPWPSCCVFTACNSSTTSATPAWRMCSTSPSRSVVSWG